MIDHDFILSLADEQYGTKVANRINQKEILADIAHQIENNLPQEMIDRIKYLASIAIEQEAGEF